MTLPHERSRAVLLMAERVMALAPYLHGKSETVRVPREMLRELYRTLRHYPTKLDMERVWDVFGRPNVLVVARAEGPPAPPASWAAG